MDDFDRNHCIKKEQKVKEELSFTSLWRFIRQEIIREKEKGYQLRAVDTRLITPYTSYLLRGFQ